ncbi:MAG: isoprenylcysteine carboxyl methyltransferase family protein [Stellaceae bacterium]
MNAVATVVVALVALERLAELFYARRNTRALLEAGGVEVGGGHYRLIVALHVAWLVAILAAVPPEAPLSVPLLALFAILQGLRAWVLLSLGRYWTTRVITLPGAPLVRRGPYRFLRHPNYLVVVAEIAVLPLAFGAWAVALIFSALNAALLTWRIFVEDQALASRRQAPHTIP